MAIDFEDLPKEEQARVFQEYLLKRREKKAAGAIKSKAKAIVLGAHKSEVEKLSVTLIEDIPILTLSKEDEKRVLASWKDKKRASKAKSQAKTAVLKKYKLELDKALEQVIGQ